MDEKTLWSVLGKLLDEKLEPINKELKAINNRLDSHEQMLTQLIGLTKEVKQETADIKEDIEFNWLKQKETEKEIHRIKQKISSRL